VTSHDIAQDRPRACRELQARYGGVCVLKGAGTLIADSEAMWLCPLGNPGMATAGMGDALAGVIVGLAVQGLTATKAAQLGVFWHAQAGDRAAVAVGSVGLLTLDLIARLPESLATLC
ncbi:MAG: ADP-dependent NAD(P)H-hydrate dehydratase, partial [Acidiferrobacter sp.]